MILRPTLGHAAIAVLLTMQAACRPAGSAEEATPAEPLPNAIGASLEPPAPRNCGVVTETYDCPGPCLQTPGAPARTGCIPTVRTCRRTVVLPPCEPERKPDELVKFPRR